MIGQFSLFVVLALVAGAHSLTPENIISADQAVPGGMPYQASFRINGVHDCGGTIISNRHILTAAHCVDKFHNTNGLTIVTGTPSSTRGGEIRTISKITIHQGYISGEPPVVHDIAVIAVDPPIRFNAVQNKLNLPSGPMPDGAIVTLSGWGSVSTSKTAFPETLQKLRVQTITADKCRQYMPADGPRIYPSHLCTYREKGRAACNGDSGGPLAYNGQVVGVVSFVYYPCGMGYPDVFASVYHHVDWIRQTMATT